MEGGEGNVQETSRLFRIRKTVLELLRDRGYVVLDTEQDLDMPFEEFSQRFEASSFNRDSLTMLKQKADDPSDQIYVFFPEQAANQSLGVKPISQKSERMEQDGINRSIIVLKTGLTPHARQAIESLSQGDRFRMEVFYENELLVNITKHILVPRHQVLSPDDKKALLVRYKLKESQLPRIQKKDPIARYYGLTQGDVVKITRPSETAGRYVSYRYCVGM